MKTKQYTLLLITLTLLLTQPACAELPNPVDAGTRMIEEGINNWITSIADDMYNSSIQFSNTTDTNNSLIKILSCTHNPYEDERVQKYRKTFSLFFLIGCVFYILGGLIIVAWSLLRERHSVLGPIHKHTPRDYMIGLGKLLLIMIGTDIFIIMLLLLESALSSCILMATVTTVPPDSSHVALYFLLAFGHLFLMIFIAWRTIVISVGVVIARLIGLGLAIPETQGFAYSALVYFVKMVFMKVVLLLIAAVGVAVTETIVNPADTGLKIIFYTALVAFLVLVAFKWTVGNAHRVPTPTEVAMLAVLK